jgi:hypothetical protein
MKVNPAISENTKTKKQKKQRKTLLTIDINMPDFRVLDDGSQIWQT